MRRFLALAHKVLPFVAWQLVSILWRTAASGFIITFCILDSDFHNKGPFFTSLRPMAKAYRVGLQSRYYFHEKVQLLQHLPSIAIKFAWLGDVTHSKSRNWVGKQLLKLRLLKRVNGGFTHLYNSAYSGVLQKLVVVTSQKTPWRSSPDFANITVMTTCEETKTIQQHCALHSVQDIFQSCCKNWL